MPPQLEPAGTFTAVSASAPNCALQLLTTCWGDRTPPGGMTAEVANQLSTHQQRAQPRGPQQGPQHLPVVSSSSEVPLRRWSFYDQAMMAMMQGCLRCNVLTSKNKNRTILLQPSTLDHVCDARISGSATLLSLAIPVVVFLLLDNHAAERAVVCGEPLRGQLETLHTARCCPSSFA